MTNHYELISANGNLSVTQTGNNVVTMGYDKENRMTVYQDGVSVTTYAYAYDGLKRNEQSGASITTLVWDGSSYVGEVR
jgi:hypothetical protein